MKFYIIAFLILSIDADAMTRADMLKKNAEAMLASSIPAVRLTAAVQIAAVPAQNQEFQATAQNVLSQFSSADVVALIRSGLAVADQPSAIIAGMTQAFIDMRVQAQGSIAAGNGNEPITSLPVVEELEQAVAEVFEEDPPADAVRVFLSSPPIVRSLDDRPEGTLQMIIASPGTPQALLEPVNLYTQDGNNFDFLPNAYVHPYHPLGDDGDEAHLDVEVGAPYCPLAIYLPSQLNALLIAKFPGLAEALGDLQPSIRIVAQSNPFTAAAPVLELRPHYMFYRNETAAYASDPGITYPFRVASWGAQFETGAGASAEGTFYDSSATIHANVASPDNLQIVGLDTGTPKAPGGFFATFAFLPPAGITWGGENPQSPVGNSSAVVEVFALLSSAQMGELSTVIRTSSTQNVIDWMSQYVDLF